MLLHRERPGARVGPLSVDNDHGAGREPGVPARIVVNRGYREFERTCQGINYGG